MENNPTFTRLSCISLRERATSAPHTQWSALMQGVDVSTQSPSTGVVKTFTVSGTSGVVSDEMYRALPDYVVALARSGETAVLSIPTLGTDGAREGMQPNLSPSSQLVFADLRDMDAALDDDAAVTDIIRRTVTLRADRAHAHPELSSRAADADLEEVSSLTALDAQVALS